MSTLESSVDALPSKPLHATVPGARASPPLEEGDGDSSALTKGKKLLRLGNKDGTNLHETDTSTSTTSTTTARTMSPTFLPSPPLTVSPSGQRASPRCSPLMRPVGASPNRRIRSASPGLHSPASSLIFERNVQEPEPSADVPAHIKTEDYIPPALDASSLAITDTQLNPDEVEIVMHSAHQPASAAVTGSLSESVHSPPLSSAGAVLDDVGASSHGELVTAEPASDYGSLDMTDPRRLSFISFADVVQAEHVEQDRHELLGTGSSEAVQFMSLSSQANRSPSPLRSPVSVREQGGSGPTSGAASPTVRVADHETTRSPASPTSAMHGDGLSASLSVEPPLQIETMRQALRKTRSGELGGGL